MGLLPVLQPQLVHFHDYRSPTADFMWSAACTAQRMYARAGVGAPEPPQNSSFRVSAGALGTVGPGWNDIGARLGRLVAALAHRLACTLESERRRDERHCGARAAAQGPAGGPAGWSAARRPGSPPGMPPAPSWAACCALPRAHLHVSCHSARMLHSESAWRTEIPRAKLGRFDPHARPAEPERAQNSV